MTLIKSKENFLLCLAKNKAAIIENLVNSPRTQKILSNRRVLRTLDEEKGVKMLKALASDILSGISKVKWSGSNEKRATFGNFKSLTFSKSVRESRAKKSFRKLVNLNERSINKDIKACEEILKKVTK